MTPPRLTPASAFASLVLAFCLVACGGGGSGGGGATTSPPPPPATDSSGMRELTSIQLSQQMSPAWNLGNSLDAGGNETNWGNPLVNQQLLNAVKAAGFKTVRIPASWNQHADANGNISPTFMARVTEVVGYARNAGLLHWPR